MMMVKLNWVVRFMLVGVWVCGYHFAQAQIESGSLTQDMVPRESKTCKDIRYNLEMMLFTLYKATVPRHALKQVLPGLAEPLLPVQCLRGEGQGKWLLHPQPLGTDPQPPRVRRQIGQFFLSAPLTSVKDPDDLPHAGMLLRDPSKDPGDHPFSSPWAPHPSLPPFDPLIKPFRGGFYGDQLPRGRRRRRSVDDAEEEEEVGKEADVAHVRRKRANGEEEKKGPSWDTFGFPGFLFSDVPDHRAPAPVPVVFPFSETSLFLSGLRQLFSPPRHSHRRRRPGRSNNNNNNNNPLLRQSGASSVALQDPYGARPNVIYGDSPPYRQTVTSRQAPVVPAPSAPVGPWSPQGQPSAPPPAAAAPSPVVISPANQASAAQANVVQPSGARSLARQPLGNQPLGGQPLGNQPLGGQPLGTQPLGGQPLGNQPLGGQPLGDQLLGGQPLRNQPLGGQPLGNQPLGGQPLRNQPLGGQPLRNQPLGGQPLGTQPLGGQPLGTQPLGGQPFGNQASGSTSLSAPPTTFRAPSVPAPGYIPSQPQVSGTGGTIYGDTLPPYSATSMAAGSSRRVKRASDNSSPSDVVTFGDFSIPADTLTKLLNPRGSRSDDTDHRGAAYRSHAPPPPPPSPRYSNVLPPMGYNSPRPYFYRPQFPSRRVGGGYPFSSPPLAPLRQAQLLNARRRVLAANHVTRARMGLPAHTRMSQQAPAAAAAATAGRMASIGHELTVSLPMGAALPVYGNHPVY